MGKKRRSEVDDDEQEEGGDEASSKRIAEPGARHRRSKTQLIEVKPVDPPTPEQLGTSHLYTVTAIQGGPRALINAEHEAARLSAKFGEEIEAKWCLATKFLLGLAELDTAQRARARYAMQWRPRFLAVVSLTRSLHLAAKAAKVSRTTVNLHRRADPDFDEQVIAAQEQAVDLLEDMTFRAAIEGEAKPVYWQGIRVGHQIEYDNRLRIEMLRAYRPHTFKTPGSKVQINTGANVFLGSGQPIDPEITAKLVGMRQESLRRLQEKKANAREVGTLALPSVPPTS